MNVVEFRITGDALWERMDRAVQKVRERLVRTARALDQAGIPYAVAGGNAVRAWVAQADEAAVRNTRDVDILLRRSDLPAATRALEQVGFVHRRAKGIDMFLDGPGAKARDAVRILFAGEKVRKEYLLSAPDVSETELLPDPYEEEETNRSEKFHVLSLEALVRMKLTSFRRKDQMHLLDMIDVELLDESWYEHFPSELASRLKELIDNPEG